MKKWPISLIAIVLPFVLLALGAVLLPDGNVNESTGWIIGFILVITFPLWMLLLALPTLGFAGIAFEVYSRRVARGWAVVPALYFGSYFALFGIERWEMVQLADEINEANGAVKIAFDPQTQSLMLNDQQDISMARLDIPAIYTRQIDGENVTVKAHHLLEEETCQLIKDEFSVQRHGGDMNIRDLRDRDGVSYPGFCVLSLPEETSRPTLTVVQGETLEKRGTVLQYQEQQATITSADGAQHSLRSATAQPLPMFPVFFPSCLGEDSTCTFLFERNSFFGEIDIQQIGREWQYWLPNALGLIEINPNQRLTAPPDTVMARVSQAVSARQARNMASVETMLADMAGEHEWLHPRGLDLDETALTRRMPAIVAAIEANMGVDGWRNENAVILANYVLRQVPGPLEPYNARFENLTQRDYRFDGYLAAYQARIAPPPPPEPLGPDDVIDFPRKRRAGWPFP